MNQAVETNVEVISPRKTRAARDTTHNDIRHLARQILTRSNLEVERAITGRGGKFPVVTFQVRGGGVKESYNRYYLGTKLDKRLAGTGYRAEVRRKDRGEDSIFVDIFVEDKSDDTAV